jgi:hypothetical protein
VIIDRVMIVLKQCSRKVGLAQQESKQTPGVCQCQLLLQALGVPLERADRGGQNGAWHIDIG